MRRRLAALTLALAVLAPAGALAIDQTGTDGPDKLVGTREADALYGLAGNDRIVGRGGDDLLSGDFGRDRILGGPGNDTLLGGGGRDKLRGGPGVDTLGCGAGRDVAFTDGTDTVGSDCELVRSE